jgi:hypothetical protein
MDMSLADERLDALLDAGVDSFFDLTERGELSPYLPRLRERASTRGLQVGYQRFPIVDRGLPDRSGMLALLGAIEAAVTGGNKIYVHCWGGVGRTGMAVACYLVRHGKSGQQALDQIAAWRLALDGLRYRIPSPETPAQIAFVREWHE